MTINDGLYKNMMRHISILLLCLGAWCVSVAQEGVNFRDITLEEALRQAKAENKLVFMDCYTSWCGPCKNMTEKIFPQKAAGDYFNPRFVCVKYDMEKGAGVELAKKYEVHAYPTFLMLRPDGTLQHRLVGGDGLEAFIARVEKGFDEQNNLSALHRRYEQGGLSKQDLFRYWEALEEAGEDARATQVYAELLAQLTEEEKTQAAYWSLYETRSCTIGSPMHDFLLAHLDALRANNGKGKVDRYLTDKYWEALGLYVMGYARKDDVPFETLQRDIPRLGVAQQAELERMLQLADLVYHRKAKELASLIEKRLLEMSVETLKTYAFGFRGIVWGSEEKTVPPHIVKVGTRLTKSVIADLERRTTQLTAEELHTYTILMDSFYGEMTPALYRRLADAGEKALAALPESKEKEYSALYFKACRKKANK